MRCSSCLQEMTPRPDGACCLCGQPVGRLIPGRKRLYIVTGALFASTLAYAMVVFIEEQTGAPKPNLSAQPLQVLAPVFLAVSAVGFAIGQWAAGRKVRVNPLLAALIEGAAAEVPVVLGLMLYFIFHTVQWFVILLGLSWLFYLYLSFKIPGYATLMDAMEAQAAAQADGVDGGRGLG